MHYPPHVEVMMLVAIPKMKDAVAPCFEVARSFVLARIEKGELVSQRILECTGCEGFGRVQTLRTLRPRLSSVTASRRSTGISSRLSGSACSPR